MSDEIVRTTCEDSVAVLHFDDGKANAVSMEALTALNAALDRAEKEAQAAVLVGRPGRFSAGFDLRTMGGDPEPMRALVGGGAELLARMAECELPIVAACTGHALAMGALLLLGADHRIGADGAFKIGLNEVAIGMTLPHFAVELAGERLSRRHLVRAVAEAEIYDPIGSVDAGYLDRVVPAEQVLTEARNEAARLAELPGRAFASTKRRLRGPTVERIRAAMKDDLAGFTGSR